MSEPDYREHTRNYYRNAETAAVYARRQRFGGGSPAEFIVGAMERRVIRRFLAGLDLHNGAVLDVPAGSGKLTGLLSTRAQYVGADVSLEMLRAGTWPAPCVQADGMQLPFRDGEFEAVVCLRLFHRVPVEVMQGVLREAQRLARAGVVFSYASPIGTPGPLGVVRRRLTRPRTWQMELTPTEVEHIASDLGLFIEHDVSISAGLTAERIVLARV